ncbi:MAG: hypothetical protein WC359_15105 [Dehalococcoidia bacterium]|jgi:hypothetical protein
MRGWIVVRLLPPENRFCVPEVRVQGESAIGGIAFSGGRDVVRLWNLLFDTVYEQRRRARVGVRLALEVDGELGTMVETVARVVAAELNVPLALGMETEFGEQLELPGTRFME